jgi:hypothetical protein
MLSNFDLNHLLTFPVKDAEARKQFLIGTLVYLAAFIIPVIPVLLATGYMMRIMRQILGGEQPRMIEWNEWGEMFVDGARLLFVRLVYMLPFFLLLCPLIGINIALPFILENAGNNADWIIVLFPIVFGGFFLVFIPLMLILSVLLPAAEVHVTDKVEFAAAFRMREWWPIFRTNWSGFLLALAIAYGISFVLTILVQFAMFTIVLICVLPFILPGIAMYVSLVMYAAFAQAYKEGKERLQSEHEAIRLQ